MKVKYLNKALLIELDGKKILVIADLHIGYEEMLGSRGVFLGRRQFNETTRDFKKIFDSSGKINEIVVLGDLKHEFHGISGQEWLEVGKILDLLLENCKKLVIVRGNHDNMLEPIARKKGVKLIDCYLTEGICFLHGDKLIDEIKDEKIEMFVLGHLHPAVTISDKYKKEKFKCFLSGRWKGKKVIILPSFFPFVEGGEISAESLDEGNFIILNKELKRFDVHVVGDKVYEFGKLGQLE